MSSGWHIQVPATTANLGPGFDCLGLALDLCNETWVWPANRNEVEVEGEGEEELSSQGPHAVLSGFSAGLHALGLPQQAIRIRQRNRIPLARGLGSSAAAIVTGLAAARAVAGLEHDASWLLEHASRLEGHPDNVAPAIYGGLTAAWIKDSGQACTVALEVAPNLAVAVAWPEIRVSTLEARAALPETYARADVAFNLGRLALLLRSLTCGDLEGLQEGVADRVHTPYRSRLISGYEDILQHVRELGGAVFISGSGPTLAAFTHADRAAAVAEGFRAGFTAAGVPCKVHWQPLSPSSAGCHVEAHT